MIAGYLIQSFENGIGNISPPTLEYWIPDNGADPSFSAQFIIFEIYGVWIMNQFILLIVLLNFVIAVLSEVYTDVTENQV
jgi:hypothetical protein